MTLAFLSWELPLLFLSASVLIVFLSKKPFEQWMGHFSIDLRAVIILFVLLLGVGIGLDFIATQLGFNDTQNVAQTANALSTIPVLAILFLFVSAVAEEVLFRGILYNLVGLAGSTILFGLFHAGYGSTVEVAGALIAGLILATGRKRFNSIYPGLIAHFLYNVAAVFLLS